MGAKTHVSGLKSCDKHRAHKASSKATILFLTK
jgi:hypothetical protein